jgi:hypothetical protein
MVKVSVTFQTSNWNFSGSLQFGLSLITTLLYLGNHPFHW